MRQSFGHFRKRPFRWEHSPVQAKENEHEGEKTIVDAAALPKWPTYYQALRAGKDGSTLRPGQVAVNPAINDKIVLWRGDITSLKIDGIVNAANSDLWAGGGICGAIHKAAGSNLQKECKKIGFCPTGSTVITQGYKLPAAHVLHSVGPTNRSPVALQNCYQSIMELCVEKKLRSVCMCCISTGIFGFPNGPACMIALNTVRKFLEVPENLAAIDLVVFCAFMIEDVKLYDEFTPVFFPVEGAAEPEESIFCSSLSCWQQNPCALHADSEAGEQKAAMDSDQPPSKHASKRSADPLAVSAQNDAKDLPKEPELKSPKVTVDGEVSLNSLTVSSKNTDMTDGTSSPQPDSLEIAPSSSSSSSSILPTHIETVAVPTQPESSSQTSAAPAQEPSVTTQNMPTTETSQNGENNVSSL